MGKKNRSNGEIKSGPPVWQKWLGGVSLLLLIGVMGFYFSVRWGAFGPIPSKADLESAEVPIASRVFSTDGELMGRYFLQDRSAIEYKDVPVALEHALLATEDIRFFQHKGVDTRSLGRVLVKSLIMGDKRSGGGSTLSQQLAKNLYPRKDFGWISLPVNKLREMIVAKRLEKIFSKQEILVMYLNTVFWGENAYGIAAAARRYFNTFPERLRMEESALLVGMLRAPSQYNPRSRPELCKERRDLVLGLMGKHGFLDSQRVDSLQQIPVSLSVTYESHHEGMAPYFREHLRLQLAQEVQNITKESGEKYNLYTDGLRIHTTLDSRLQRYAEMSVREHMTKIQKLFERQHRNLTPEHPAVKAAKIRVPRYITLSKQGLTEPQIDSIFLLPDTTGVVQWDKTSTEVASIMDSLMYYQRLLRAGFVALESTTGAVRAWVGGPNHKVLQYDHVTAQRQTGSSFKPIVYAAAIEEGHNPCEYISNDPVVFSQYDNWSPKNADEDYGGEYSMQGALTHSVNIVSVNLIMKIGPKKVVDFAQKMGMNQHIPVVPSLALGTAEVSLLEMTAAYGSLTNGGYAVIPRYVSKIEDRYGNVIWEAPSLPPKRIMAPSTSEMMTHMLGSVVRGGTAAGLRTRYGLKADMVGKTGTTQEQADGWFVGAVPQLVAGAWVGADDRRIHFKNLRTGQGASTAMPIWAGFMKRVFDDPHFAALQYERFPTPSPSVISQLDCDPFQFLLAQSSFKEWWEKQKQKNK